MFLPPPYAAELLYERQYALSSDGSAQSPAPWPKDTSTGGLISCGLSTEVN